MPTARPGWIAAIGAGALPSPLGSQPAIARDLLGSDADFLAATVFAPTGRAVPVGGAASPRWPLAVCQRLPPCRVVPDRDVRLRRRRAAHASRARPRLAPVVFPPLGGRHPRQLGRSGPARHRQQRHHRPRSHVPTNTPSARSSSRPATTGRCGDWRSSRWWE